jgi:hypothetical protein
MSSNTLRSITFRLTPAPSNISESTELLQTLRTRLGGSIITAYKSSRVSSYLSLPIANLYSHIKSDESLGMGGGEGGLNKFPTSPSTYTPLLHILVSSSTIPSFKSESFVLRSGKHLQVEVITGDREWGVAGHEKWIFGERMKAEGRSRKTL